MKRIISLNLELWKNINLVDLAITSEVSGERKAVILAPIASTINWIVRRSISSKPLNETVWIRTNCFLKIFNLKNVKIRNEHLDDWKFSILERKENW